MNYSRANCNSFGNNYIGIINGLVIMLMIGLVLNGCGGDSMTGSSNSYNQEQNTPNINGEAKIKFKSRDWRSLFKRAMSIGNKSMKETGVQMIDYQFVGNISSSKDANRLVNKLLKSDAYFPMYTISNSKNFVLMGNEKNNDLKNYTLMKKSAIQNMKQTQNQKQYEFKNLREHLDKIINRGDGKVRIKWRYDGNVITTIAVVNKHRGFVYDNIVSNTKNILTTKLVRYSNGKKKSQKINYLQSNIDLLKTNSVEQGCQDTTIQESENLYLYEGWGSSVGQASVSLDADFSPSSGSAIPSASCSIDYGYRNTYSCDAQIKKTNVSCNSASAPYIMVFADQGSSLGIYFSGTGFQISNSGGLIKKSASTLVASY